MNNLSKTLYRPEFEHSACGIGFIARTTGIPDHEVVKMGLEAVGRMAHRSGIDADGLSGDGAGILTHIPHRLLASEIDDLPAPGDYGLGMLFLPLDNIQTAIKITENVAAQTIAHYTQQNNTSMLAPNGTNGSNFLLAKGDTFVEKSIDGGATWNTLGGSHTYSWHGWCDLIAVAPDDEDIIMAGGNWAQRTADGGTTWNNMTGLHADHHVAVFAPSDPNIVYEANDGGVYRSDDKGATWEKVSHGLVITQFYDIGAWNTIGTVLGGGTQDQGTNMSTGGLTWKKIYGADGGYFVVHPTDPRTIYSESQYTNIRKSTDGGNTWTTKTAGITGSTPWTGVITPRISSSHG